MRLLLALIMTINISSNIEKIVLGGGCFWCIEAVFEKITGVIKVESGYAGGNEINPTYKDVTKDLTNHAEVCKITYDKTVIDLKEILDIFYVAHDPTQVNRQGNDIGRHYRSIILYGSKEEETYINLSRNIPVYITYRTVFFDEFGQIHYRADVYGRDALVYMALVEAGVSIY